MKFFTAWGNAIIVFFMVQMFFHITFSPLSFPNYDIRGINRMTTLKSFLMDQGMSFDLSNKFDFTNPSPRGIIALLLACGTFFFVLNIDEQKKPHDKEKAS